MLLLIMGLLENRYYDPGSKSGASRAEIACREQGESVEEGVGKRDALGYPPKHKELRRMIVQILNNNPEGTRCDRVGD